MKQSFKNETTGDEVVHTPGKTTIQNLAAEATVEITPLKIELRTGVSQSVTLSVADGIVIEDGPNTIKISIAGGIEISDGTQVTRLSLLQLFLDNAAGKTNSITDEQVVISDGTNLNTISAGSVHIGDGTNNSTLSPAHLLLDEGGGMTNSLTGEQMVISSSGKSGVYEDTGITLTEAGGSLNLDILHGLVVTADGDTLSAGPNAGIAHQTGSGESASFSATGGIYLDDGSSGTVSIYTQSSEAISIQATEGCDVDGAGEPTTTSMKVLRGAATPV